MKTYQRQDLIHEIRLKYGGSSYQLLNERPTKRYIACMKCHRISVRVYQERYGDGTANHVNWAADAWIGLCQVPECGCLNLWIELVDQEILDQENRRLLIALCDRELKSL